MANAIKKINAILGMYKIAIIENKMESVKT